MRRCNKNNKLSYKGELDNVDPFKFGIMMRKNEEIGCKIHAPTSSFVTSSKDCLNFLINFSGESQLGWREEDKRIMSVKIDFKIQEFKKDLPFIGNEVYVEFETNKGKYFRHKIVYIAEDKRSVVGESLETHNKGVLRVLGYPDGFVKFYNKKPD